MRSFKGRGWIGCKDQDGRSGWYYNFDSKGGGMVSELPMIPRSSCQYCTLRVESPVLHFRSHFQLQYCIVLGGGIINKIQNFNVRPKQITLPRYPGPFSVFLCLLSFSDFEDDISSLTQFTPEMVVEASVRCLQIIIPEFQSPTHLPDAMSARYRMCTGLANACQVRGERKREKHAADSCK